MMTILDGRIEKNMRYPVEETAAKHERIVKEASRLFRERGFENVGCCPESSISCPYGRGNFRNRAQQCCAPTRRAHPGRKNSAYGAASVADEEVIPRESN